MLLVDAFDVVRTDARIGELARLLTGEGGAVTAAGLWGSCAPILGAIVGERLKRPLLLVTAHADEADNCLDDVTTALGTAPEQLPQLETFPHERAADDELYSERLRLCLLLSGEGAAQPCPDANGARPAFRGDVRRSSAAPEPSPPPCIVASIHALMQPVPSREAIAAQSFTVAVGRPLAPEQLVEWLSGQGFNRCDQVELPGDYARRGGIVDVYSNAHSDPIRIEFFGDEIESIRLFDAGTQRSSHALESIRIPARAVVEGRAGGPRDTTSFLALLPPETIIAFHEPLEIQELGRTYWQQLGQRAGIVPVDAVFRRANDFAQLYLQRFGGGFEHGVDFAVGSLPHFEPQSSEALEALAALAGECDVVVLCDNRPEQQRFEDLLNELPTRPARVRTTVGVIHRGFRWDSTAFVPRHELFHRYRQRRTLRRVQPARPIDSFFDLDTGDYVVHALHGIGRFRGLKTLERSGRRDEYLAIEFADHAVVHVPTSQIHVVQKYIGSFRGRPKLSKLGGTTWKRTKQRVAEAVTDLAAELLALQAERATRAGTGYPHDTTWQREFEGSFLYAETEDQIRALAEIKNDMVRARPMDRLLCGDVGFGKTELAVRAAFKVVEYGKQVAVLVPTTVLAEQHHQTFSERLADYPFAVEVLSRFRTTGEQARILERARKGLIDILIGTHRLLSGDVRFGDLGLVVIDEEQRFGVEAKERLKRLRAAVDVLTLTATPIPRTLHMALLGIREISVPEARIVVGHGRMKGRDLEDVMIRFVCKQADVLVSTNIIESGIDIPSVNTIFINRAERFGLADLHQLRGRVGRSKHRAYCYLLLSPKHAVKDAAARRLKAIEQYCELGAGFQIAMRDLEIRGAGNILGSEQSGHIEAVGYEMYCRLLEQAVRRIRNEPAELWRPVNLELGITAAIPRAYARSQRQRMEIYKRLASARTVDDVGVLRDDLRDAFGPVPDDVETLLALAEIRVLAQPWGIRSIVLDPPDVIFAIDDLEKAQALFAEGPGSPRLPDPQTVHWRLPRRYLEPPTLLTILRRQLAGQVAADVARPALQN